MRFRRFGRNVTVTNDMRTEFYSLSEWPTTIKLVGTMYSSFVRRVFIIVLFSYSIRSARFHFGHSAVDDLLDSASNGIPLRIYTSSIQGNTVRPQGYNPHQQEYSWKSLKMAWCIFVIVYAMGFR